MTLSLVYLKLAILMVECWRKSRFDYSELEEMFLINMSHNNDPDLLARELGKTLNDERLALRLPLIDVNI